jgi:hypothetical protein
MNNYKITNITNRLDKRTPNFNSIVKIEYIENMVKKSINLSPNKELIISLPYLPQSVNQQRMNKLIIVDEINNYQVNLLYNKEIESNSTPKINKKK